MQEHHDASSFFNKTWVEMRAEQRDVTTGDFWLGLDDIRELTHENQYKLHIELNDVDGISYAVEYNEFSVGNEESRFILSVHGYRHAWGADPGSDALIAVHNGRMFATWDRNSDPDHTADNAAALLGGAYWYGAYTDPPTQGPTATCRACLNSSPDGVFGWFRYVGDPLMLSQSKMFLDCRLS